MVPHRTNNIIDSIIINIRYILESGFAWILTIFGFNTHVYIDPGDLSLDGLLKKLTLVLASSVSIATLYKIRKDLKKK